MGMPNSVYQDNQIIQMIKLDQLCTLFPNGDELPKLFNCHLYYYADVPEYIPAPMKEGKGDGPWICIIKDKLFNNVYTDSYVEINNNMYFTYGYEFITISKVKYVKLLLERIYI